MQPLEYRSTKRPIVRTMRNLRRIKFQGIVSYWKRDGKLYGNGTAFARVLFPSIRVISSATLFPFRLFRWSRASKNYASKNFYDLKWLELKRLCAQRAPFSRQIACFCVCWILLYELFTPRFCRISMPRRNSRVQNVRHKFQHDIRHRNTLDVSTMREKSSRRGRRTRANLAANSRLNCKIACDIIRSRWG